MYDVFFLVILIIFLYMSFWYILSLLIERSDIVDIAWGLGFIIVGAFLYLTGKDSLHLAVVFLMVLFWGVRLSLHIYLRNMSKKEDFRYKKWREQWGKWFYLRSYFQIFMLQGFLMFLISLPIIVASFRGNFSFEKINYLGVVLWFVGFLFESVGDLQLKKFKAIPDNKDKVMNKGLWKFTRHPNYFGEVAQWWGIFLVVATLPFGYLAVISPLTISLLILKVSGIPMVEDRYKNNLEFMRYQKSTSAFFPRFPKNLKLTMILPGYSINNKEWAYETKANLKIKGEIVVIEWRRWETNGDLDDDYEVQKILSIIGSRKVKFIAKSIGTKILMDVITKIPSQVERFIMCGIPMNPLEYMQNLKNFNKDKMIIFQNSRDPFMSYNLIENYIHQINKEITIVEKQSDTHDYPYYKEFNKFLS